ncbi:MAG TPA: RNB domain-containing ribonuclease [Gammaproteobacteria bacterium]|nr:RNB domain-containing ribonuclease [Gammaproteobacteria bacterium]
MSVPGSKHRSFLWKLASEAMLERGFEPEFSPSVMAAIDAMQDTAPEAGPDVRDTRELPWCSIDNDDSRDLDQLTVAEPMANGDIRIMVAIADVTTRVTDGSAPDRHARINTTSVYTPARIFSMLPERLSTDLTSLNPGVDRLAFVVEAEILANGEVGSSSVYRALVHNHAQLAYPSVGAWLEGKGEIPVAAKAVPALAENLRLQDRAARIIEDFRHEQGALTFAPIEVKAHLRDETVHELILDIPNRARGLIENFMIVANGVVARFLADHGFPVVRRVIESPERWERIVDIASHLGTQLPEQPDARALQAFLTRRRAADPLRFPDLSLSIIKLLGRGQYVANFPGRSVDGHFALAVDDYTHSTAPNRRYPDVITQRLVRAALNGRPCPFEAAELEALALHCTEKENDAKRVERRLVKSAAALLLERRIGQLFDGVITGAGSKGTWVRTFEPPVEGRIEDDVRALDVGDTVRVKLLRADPRRGYIDFECVGHEPVRRRR